MELASAFFTFAIFLIISFPLITSHSPFGFMKDLQGCHKGDKLQGIHNLKNYLNKIGYLSYDVHNHPRHHIDDDNFDDELELAIRTYQVNYNLNATGILDANTIAQISTPGCGVPDIINGTSRMKSNKNHHHHHHGHHLHTVSHFSFFQGSPKWPPSKFHLTYAFNPTVPKLAMAPIRRAFNTWRSRTHFTFSQTLNFRSADITISFERGHHGDDEPFDGLGGTIAHAFSPTNGRFHYDAGDPFDVGAVRGAYDYETVALHEIGHLLGLGHSSIEGAIMWRYIPIAATKGLHPDDIAGIRALYNIA